MALIVRPQGPEDDSAVAEVNEDAFERPDEAALVAALLRGTAFLPGLSLVAEVHGEVVDHILFTRLHVGAVRTPGLALAPMAVRKAHQRRGVGSALVREGLRAATTCGEAFAIVVGHPEYYPRFGFAPASRFGIRASFEVRDESLMALELRPGGLRGVAGRIEWAPEFGLVSP
ncbi:MAG TPA: N-acetyltransferase [Vicinamibacteria bacterium]|nr:N-acetyltransferase [Vicinamibacteria bacterium]